MTTRQAGLNGESAITTAHIETLTATVNTLVVGARQITLSIAKQLDVTELADLKVMGRVRIDRGVDDVIGTAPDGSLAIAHIKLRCDWRSGPYCILPPRSIDLCSWHLWAYKNLSAAIILEATFPTDAAPPIIKFNVGPEACDWCTINAHYRGGSRPVCPSAMDASAHDEVKKRVASWNAAAAEDRARYEAARSAPLIVLAGLR